jgi:hypothetical protein
VTYEITGADRCTASGRYGNRCALVAGHRAAAGTLHATVYGRRFARTGDDYVSEGQAQFPRPIPAVCDKVSMAGAGCLRDKGHDGYHQWAESSVFNQATGRLAERLESKMDRHEALSTFANAAAMDTLLGREQKAREAMVSELVRDIGKLSGRVERLEPKLTSAEVFQRDLVTGQQLHAVKQEFALQKHVNNRCDHLAREIGFLRKELADVATQGKITAEAVEWLENPAREWTSTSPEPPRDRKYTDRYDYVWGYTSNTHGTGWTFNYRGPDDHGPFYRWADLCAGSTNTTADFPWKEVSE